MGSHIRALLDREGEAAQTALQKVPEWFEEWEAALSRFRPDSELSRLNRSHGQPTAISHTLRVVIEEALRAAADTGGVVHPLLYGAMVAAGYEHPFDPAEIHEDREAMAANPVLPDWRAIRFDRPRERVSLPGEGKLDLGGIAKGWAADTAAARLGRHGPVLVDAGGDISVRGLRADGSPWPVGVANPFAPGDILFTLALQDGGVATSGRDYRKWISGGVPRHHLIDPRTMQPADTDVLTATVIGPNTRRAESAAKAALILGSDRGIEWLNGRAGLEGMLVLEDRRIVYSRRFEDFIWRYPDPEFIPLSGGAETPEPAGK